MKRNETTQTLRIRRRCWCGALADGIAWRWSAAQTREEVAECWRCKQEAEAADRRAGVSSRGDLGWRWEPIPEETDYV